MKNISIKDIKQVLDKHKDFTSDNSWTIVLLSFIMCSNKIKSIKDFDELLTKVEKGEFTIDKFNVEKTDEIEGDK